MRKNKKNNSTPTIVGGQPIGKQDSGSGLPHGIEALILLSAADSTFRKDFSRNREKTLQKAGIILTEPEQMILDTTTDQELFAMAERTGSTPRTGKRGLMTTAVSLAALASLTAGPQSAGGQKSGSPSSRPALSQLDASDQEQQESPLMEKRDQIALASEDTRGIRPDDPTATPTHPLTLGIQPDDPTATPTHPASYGIQPDTPTPTITPTFDPIDGIRPTSTPTPTAPPTPIPDADLDGDGTVDHKDLMLFMQQWYKDQTGNKKLDD